MEKKKPGQKKKDGSAAPYGTVPGVPPIYHSTVMYRTVHRRPSQCSVYVQCTPRETSDWAEVKKKSKNRAINRANASTVQYARMVRKKHRGEKTI